MTRSDAAEGGRKIDAVAPTHSVVVPVYRNLATLPALLERLGALSPAVVGSMEAVFVVDGSPDDSADLLRSLAPAAPFPVQVVELSRNFGAFSAIRAGLQLARGQYVAVVAADLQEPPELVEGFFAALKKGSDVAVGVRTSRDDPALSSLSSRAYWSFYRRFIIPEIPRGGVDVFAVTSQVRDQVVALRESHTSLVGMLYWLGFSRAEVPYERAKRAEGKSGWSLRRKVRYLMDSVFSFTDLPITLLIAIGVVGVLGSLTAASVVFVAWALGSVDVSGYTPLMLSFLLIGSLLLSGLGVVGSYVWRAYENTKQRPTTVVARRDAFDGEAAPAEGGREQS